MFVTCRRVAEGSTSGSLSRAFSFARYVAGYVTKLQKGVKEIEETEFHCREEDRAFVFSLLSVFWGDCGGKTVEETRA